MMIGNFQVKIETEENMEYMEKYMKEMFMKWMQNGSIY